MDLHVRVLAVFHIVFGIIGLVGALVFLIVFGGMAGAAGFAVAEEPDAWIAVPLFSIIGTVLILVTLTLSVPGIIGGWGLLRRRSWARVLMIVLSALHLINIPFGPVLAVYGLWVLLSEETESLFSAPRQVTT